MPYRVRYEMSDRREPVLQIRLLGGLSLVWEGTPLPSIPSRLACSLFAYLVTYRHHAHRRELLAGIFWPDQPEPIARRRLRQALWLIRRALAPLHSPVPLLLTEGDTVQFNVEAPYWLDIEEFQDLCSQLLVTPSPSPGLKIQSLKRAVALYRGDFLAGFYEDWVAAERERLRDMYLMALTYLLERCKEHGAYEEALIYARQLVAADPLHEHGHREVMRLCYLLGRHNEALQQYEVCRSILARELGVEPTEATTALYGEIAAQIREAKAPHLPLKAGPPASPLLEERGDVPLVGREAERAALVGYLERALEGKGGLVLLEGEAGVGKTRLLQEVARDAQWRGMQVLWGRGRELTEPPPYSVLTEALRAGLTPLRATQLAQLMEGIWLRQVSLLLPELAAWLPDLPPSITLEPEQERIRLLEALARVVSCLGRIAPHLLILEDLQWADMATLEALTYLVSRLATSRVLVIGSYRGEEAREEGTRWEALRALDRAGVCERLELSRLTAEETGELTRRGLGLMTRSPRFEARLYQETEGNPLFLLETLRALYEEGLLYRDASGEWSTPWDETTVDYAELPLPAGVYQVIARRLQRLGPDERTMLNAAAVLGGECDFELLMRTSGLERDVGLEAVNELMRRRLLEEEPTVYRFSHDKVRQVAYMEMTEEERRRLHHRAGEALEALVSDRVETLAFHFTQAEVWDKARAYHLRAGERAQAVHAYEKALTHYQRALELTERDDLSMQWEIRLRREEVLGILGQREEQAAELVALVDLAGESPRRLVEVHRRRAWLLAHTGDFEEAEKAAREALILARELADEEKQAAVLVALGTTLNWRGNPAQAIPYLEAAIAVYRRRSDPRREAETRLALGSALLLAKRYDVARAELEAALALCEEINDKLGQTEALTLLGILHMEQGKTDQAEESYRRALALSRAIGYRHAEARNLTNLGNLLYFQGHLTRALEAYDESAAIFTELGNRRGEAFVRGNLATVRHNLLGDDETAARDARMALSYYQEAGDQAGQAQCLDVLGEIARVAGDLHTAREHLLAALAAAQAAQDGWTEVSVRRSLMALALEERRLDEAEACLRAARAICRELELTDREVTLLIDQAQIALAREDPEAALAATSQAMERLRPGVEQAYLIPYWHAQALSALHRHTEARAALQQAYDMLQEVLQGLSPDQRQRSLLQVPEHRAIVEAWKATQPPRAPFRLPRANAPTGRPLRDDEWVEGTWTVEAPEDEAISGKVARRQHRLLRLLRETEEQGAAPTVDDLAKALRVSRATIKRDLAALRRAGHRVRTRGSRAHPSRVTPLK